ncbi:proteoglycan 4-like [Anopheles stephensi]|uniref:proteoglycan 4-like n=1 Tax=Anopheles stephensi TaxID=30069 RepID=UPI0016588C25|nr:proteoglycan 4-like [Anopheles stephensi]
MWSFNVVIALCGVCSVFGAALNDNIDIDIKVDSDSKLYHQGKTVEGSFNYGYNVPRRNYNQYQHKVKGPDGVTYGCYGFVDPTNGTHLYHYVSDLKGYRVVPPNQPTKVYTERVANSVANIYDSVGETYDWDKLYFPDVCRVLQKSKEERNELSIPKGFQVNDDGTVTQTTQKPKPASSTTTRRTATPSAATKPRPTAGRATKPQPTPARATPRASPATTRRAATSPPTPTTTKPTTARTTPAAPTTPKPAPKQTTPRTTATTRRQNTGSSRQQQQQPKQQQPPTPRVPVPVQTTQARNTAPKNTFKPDSFPLAAPKPSGNKFGNNRDNFIGAPATNTAETLKPPQDLQAVGQDISELKLLLQMLLKSINNSPKANAPDCDDAGSLGQVNPNAKQVFLPLVIVDTLPGSRGSLQQQGAQVGGLPAGSQFAIPSIGYGASRCNTCG